MVRRSGGAAVAEPEEDIEDLTVTESEDTEDLAEDENDAPRTKRSARVISPEEQEAIFNDFRGGGSLASAARAAGIKLELLARWLTRGGFEHSNSRMAQAARILPPEEPFYTFARQAEEAFNAGAEARNAKAPSTRTERGPAKVRVSEFDEQAADKVLELIGKGATLNVAARQAGTSVIKVLGWLRAGAYPMIVPSGRRIAPEDAQDPYKSFATSFQEAEAQAAAE